MSTHTPDIASQALERACRAVEASARQTAERILNYRAEDYIREPWQLDMIEPGLSEREPADRLRRILELQQIEIANPTGGGGLVNTSKVNLRAAEIATRRQYHALTAAMAERRNELIDEALEKAKAAQDQMTAELEHLADAAPAKKKFRVHLQQYVEEIATIEVEAVDEDEARAIAKRNAHKAAWEPGEDAYSAEVYAVCDEHGHLVWGR